MISSPRCCLSNPYNTDFVGQGCFAYFAVKLGDHDKSWIPHKICKICVEYVWQWKNKEEKFKLWCAYGVARSMKPSWWFLFLFICMWDSRAKQDNWKVTRPLRETMTVWWLWVDRKKIILPPLHIKLGLTKQFVKALDKDGDCFKYIHRIEFWINENRHL